MKPKLQSDPLILSSYKEAVFDATLMEAISSRDIKEPGSLRIREIDLEAISDYETWLNSEYDFGWERVPKWKRRDPKALDIALWHGEKLGGLCYASPKDSREKMLVLYLQRNPDKSLPTAGHVAWICLTAVRFYGVLLDLKWVVVKDPLPEARHVYERHYFKNVPGVGLAYDLEQDYADIEKEAENERKN
ncbi:hypothetical protein [Pseudomonas sp. RIT-PI-AD]|uniref:hypothetical protein n=1 Tax=Pseudomonas sp. RIT-PI-AD TaxID=3035294 RepID=UPI0021DA2B99|nr:hypothetical protein [Pseudomonas sp. RIT-PI-AD]